MSVLWAHTGAKAYGVTMTDIFAIGLKELINTYILAP